MFTICECATVPPRDMLKYIQNILRIVANASEEEYTIRVFCYLPFFKLNIVIQITSAS